MFTIPLFATSLLFALYGSSNAFLVTSRKMLVEERLDPILSPFAVSSHTHAVVGSSGFASNVTYQQLTGASCSTIEVPDDKSNYWVPEAYGINADGSFTALPMAEFRIYYMNLAADGKISPFPPGFRMLMGSATATTPAGPEGKLVFYCQNGGNETQVPFIPPDGCQGFMRMSIEFPGCWDGVSTDSPDHISHMAYRDGSNNCSSPSHPVAVFTIVVEAGFDTSKYGGPGQVVLATGDTFGGSIHADFVFGWPTALFQQVINDPTCNSRQNVFGQDQQCETLAPLANVTAALDCIYSQGIVEEPVGIDKPLAALPGCNPLWGGSVPKPTCNPPPPTPVLSGPPDEFFNFFPVESPSSPPEDIPLATIFRTASSSISVSVASSSKPLPARPTSTVVKAAQSPTTTPAKTTTLLTSTKVSNSSPTSSQVCIAGTGSGNYEGLCSFACHYGYCPPGPCTCTQSGAPVPTPPTTGQVGVPLANEDNSYLGLCSFDCNHGYCPSTACRLA